MSIVSLGPGAVVELIGDQVVALPDGQRVILSAEDAERLTAIREAEQC